MMTKSPDTSGSIMKEPVMETETSKTSPILNVAWARFSELDTTALARSRSHLLMRRGIAIVGVLATLFAILSQLFPPATGLIGLVSELLISYRSLIGLAFTKYYSTGDWLITRSGAEEILKEITFPHHIRRTNRGGPISKRLAEIQRQVYRNLGGELVQKYNGPIPSNYYPDDPNSDPACDLNGDQYFKYRLDHQQLASEKSGNTRTNVFACKPHYCRRRAGAFWRRLAES
jgi:hypothetical protein